HLDGSALPLLYKDCGSVSEAVCLFDLESRRDEDSEKGALHVVVNIFVVDDNSGWVREVDSLLEQLEGGVSEFFGGVPIDVHAAVLEGVDMYIRARSVVRSGFKAPSVYGEPGPFQFPAHFIGQPFALGDDFR
ncbi:hypothetical protein ACFT5D_26835, partial [Streptomyces sp. NPDC057144]|uniref:hypothetical protein n=1 Tax=Streptomyces sp. NPDC057144 TaxID=3346034 RepID=UPI00363612C0